MYLSHTITKIDGYQRVEGVHFAQVGADKKPVKETEKYLECDTLLLSVGLIPENELTRKADIEISPVTNGPKVNQYMQTSAENIFACGNVVHVNDLADNVSVESRRAGAYAARYAMGCLARETNRVENMPGGNVRYLCPQSVSATDEDETVIIRAKSGDKILSSKKAARVNPGEMEHIEIHTKDIEENEVTVEVVKEG